MTTEVHPQVIIKTEWHDREGGYWEAQAYTADDQKISGEYATMVEERAAVARVIGHLVADGVTNVICHSLEPISCEIAWENVP